MQEIVTVLDSVLNDDNDDVHAIDRILIHLGKSFSVRVLNRSNALYFARKTTGKLSIKELDQALILALNSRGFLSKLNVHEAHLLLKLLIPHHYAKKNKISRKKRRHSRTF